MYSSYVNALSTEKEFLFRFYVSVASSISESTAGKSDVMILNVPR